MAKQRQNSGKEIKPYNTSAFEAIRHTDENNEEYWSARELKEVLQYVQWRRFEDTIKRAKTACETAGRLVSDHFADVGKMVSIGSDAQREQKDIHLSRYACYLIAMNGDPRKEAIAAAQTYFAVKTREREVEQEQQEEQGFDKLTENQKRLTLRQRVSGFNKSLAKTAQDAGVKTSSDFAEFQNCGYRGLYNGMTARDIQQHKGLKRNQAILDHMGGMELAANLFRITQTEDKIRRENIQGKENANRTHYDVGAKVRQTIQELGGTMPEDLPTPDKSIKQIEREETKKLTSKK